MYDNRANRYISPDNTREQSELSNAQITIVIPSFNQGQFLEATLVSVFEQELPVEVFVMDAGSEDNSIEIINKWEHKLAGWRSHADEGQSAAINEGIARGTAPYVCWTASVGGKKLFPYITQPFSPRLFANFCFIAQPATLLTRHAWECVGGLNESLQMAMDYDLWWRLYNQFGKPEYCREFVAATRMHKNTKTANHAELHYRESIDVIGQHYGSVPFKWRAAQPVLKLLRRFN